MSRLFLSQKMYNHLFSYKLVLLTKFTHFSFCDHCSKRHKTVMQSISFNLKCVIGHYQNTFSSSNIFKTLPLFSEATEQIVTHLEKYTLKTVKHCQDVGWLPWQVADYPDSSRRSRQLQKVADHCWHVLFLSVNLKPWLDDNWVVPKNRFSKQRPLL